MKFFSLAIAVFFWMDLNAQVTVNDLLFTFEGVSVNQLPCDDCAKVLQDSRPVASDTGFVTRTDTILGGCLWFGYMVGLDYEIVTSKPIVEPCIKIEPMILMREKLAYFLPGDSGVYEYRFEENWRLQSEYFTGKEAKFVLKTGGSAPVALFYPRDLRFK